LKRTAGGSPDRDAADAGGQDEFRFALVGNWRVLLVGLFVAYLDRTNLSVAIPSVARDMGFAGERFPIVSSWALTIFLIGYALANVFGGMATWRLDPKPVVIWCFAIWSLATVLMGFTSSLTVLLICRLILGLTEGVYWPPRFAEAWFAPHELTKANAVIQYYGQYIALPPALSC
jgi:MFS family permease